MVVRTLRNKDIFAAQSALWVLLFILFQSQVVALDSSTNAKILAVVKSYRSGLEHGNVKSLLENFTKAQRDTFQSCLADERCADRLRDELLLVKLKDFRVGTISEPKGSPGVSVEYSATRVFGSSEPPSQQAGSGELLLILEAESWKIAKVSWIPSQY